MFKLLKWIIILVVIGVGYWLIAPMVTGEKSETPYDGVIELGVNTFLQKTGQGVEKAGQSLQETDVAKIKGSLQGIVMRDNDHGNLAEQLEDESLRAAYLKTVETMSDVQAEPYDVSEIGMPSLMSQGDFSLVAHPVTGTARVFKLSDDRGWWLRFSSFSTQIAPGLHVYLTPVEQVQHFDQLGSDVLAVGPLDANIGDQQFRLDADVDLSSYKSVVIASEPFEVVTAAAPLESVR